MKKILFVALAAFMAGALQPLMAQDVLDILAEDACDCISKKDTDKMSMEDLQMQLSMCLMESVGNNQEAFQKQYGDFNPSDQAAMQEFGQQVGMKMVTKCPQVMMKVAGSAQAPPPSAEAPSTGQTKASGSLTGTFQGVSGEHVAVLTIKEDNGRAQNLLWLGYFEGSDQLIENSAGLKGKTVTVEFETIEVYAPKAKEYFDRKKVTSLKVQ